MLNRKTQSTDARASGIVTALVYDANDNLLNLSRKPGGGQLRQAWLYDLLDRQVQETDPLGNVGTTAYDAADRRTSAHRPASARSSTSAYDLLNRETGESWYNAVGTQVNTLTFTHDPNDNLLTAVNSTSANTMGYDAAGPPGDRRVPSPRCLTNSYDRCRQPRIQVQEFAGGTTTQVFDALNRMTTMLPFSGNSATLRDDFDYGTGSGGEPDLPARQPGEDDHHRQFGLQLRDGGGTPDQPGASERQHGDHLAKH